MEIKEQRTDDRETHHQSIETNDTVAVNELKVLIFDVILPLIDILVDIAKALSLVFEDQHIESYERFSEHFLQTGVYGVISLLIKWSPALVAGLHFQDMQR